MVSISRVLLLFTVATLPGVASSREAVSAPFQGRCKTETTAFQSREGGCKNLETGLVWSMANPDPLTQVNASAYCQSLKEGKGRWDDWRLPTDVELTAISKNQDASKHFRFNVFRFFWADDQTNQEYAFQIQLAGGDEAFKKKTEQGAVLCVRQGSTSQYGCSSEDDAFVTKSGGCLDLTSGKVWSRFGRQRGSHTNAYYFCGGLRDGGHNGWHLPSLEEVSHGFRVDGLKTHLRDLPNPTRFVVWLNGQDEYSRNDRYVKSFITNGIYDGSYLNGNDTPSPDTLCIR